MKLAKTALIALAAFGLCTMSVQAESVYKWVDANGVTHYGDGPRSKKEGGSETITIQTPKVGTVAPTRSSSGYVPKRTSVRSGYGATNMDYSVAVTSPAPGDEIRANNGVIHVSASVNPRPQGNYTLRVFIDGALYASAANSQRIEVQGVPRGEHSVTVKLQTQDGKIIASEPVSFSVLRVAIARPRHK